MRGVRKSLFKCLFVIVDIKNIYLIHKLTTAFNLKKYILHITEQQPFLIERKIHHGYKKELS